MLLYCLNINILLVVDSDKHRTYVLYCQYIFRTFVLLYDVLNQQSYLIIHKNITGTYMPDKMNSEKTVLIILYNDYKIITFRYKFIQTFFYIEKNCSIIDIIYIRGKMYVWI